MCLGHLFATNTNQCAILNLVVNKGSVRRKSKEIFQKVIALRKQGHSYSEIIKETGVAKSTINCWITFAGLNLSQEHLQIQARKRLENHAIATEAAKITKKIHRENDIQKFVQSMKKYFDDPLFVAAVMLYEAEGAKTMANGFSNSDYKVVVAYLNFLKKYLLVEENDITYRLYVHEVRKEDLPRITRFWAKKLSVRPEDFRISWKHNIVSKKRVNLDYVGQAEIRIIGQTHFIGKISAISDIILDRFSKLKY